MENIQEKFREIDLFHLTSFLAWTFFLAHCDTGELKFEKSAVCFQCQRFLKFFNGAAQKSMAADYN